MRAVNRVEKQLAESVAGQVEPDPQFDPQPDPPDLNAVACVKKNGDVCERYIFIFEDRDANAMLRQLGRMAANPELSFAWWDAAKVAKRIREEGRKVNRP